MVVSDLNGAFSDGRRYRATRYELEIISADGRLLERIDLHNVASVGRDHAAIGLRLEDGSARVFNFLSIDEAGHLEQFLRSNIPPAVMARPAAPPPPAQQFVRVEGNSGSSAVMWIAGVIAVVLLVVLAVVLLMVLDDDNGDDTIPIQVPTEVPAEQPTEESTPEPETTPEARGVDGRAAIPTSPLMAILRIASSSGGEGGPVLDAG